MRTRTRHAAAAKIIVALAAGLLLALSAPTALASPASEQQQGAQVLNEVGAGKLSAHGLTGTQYEHVGQYLMGHALGSTQTYEAMDSLMDRMMGQSASGQMYRYLGERYLGKNTQPDGRSLPMYGWMANMMSAYRARMPYAGMMSQYLRSNGGYPSMMGGGYNYGVQGSSSSGGWPTGAIMLVAVLGGVLLVGVLAIGLPKLRGHGTGTSTARPI
jgi:hypothetical protein